MFRRFTQQKHLKITAFALLLTITAWLLPVNAQEASAAKAQTLQNPQALQNPRFEGEVTTWDCLYFGHYPQSADGKGGFQNEAIRWRVLWTEGNEAFLLSDKLLDATVYHQQFCDVTWETSTVRKWLNGTGADDFLGKAFTAAEQEAILEKTIQNPDDPAEGTPGGNATADKVFFLSAEEAENRDYGFPVYTAKDGARRALVTDYTKSLGVATSITYPGAANWWLRSPGHRPYIAKVASFWGSIFYDGAYVHKLSETADRPALYLNLDSVCWSYAGTVSSDGQSTGTAPIKGNQYISCKASFSKTYGSKAFSLGAKTSGNGKLTYESDDTKVARVSKDGLVSLTGPGRTTITITAEATDDYKEASKAVTIIVKPRKASLKKVSSSKKGTLTAVWKQDSKATGYEVVAARDSRFKKIEKAVTVKGSKKTTTDLKKLSSKKTYYVKVRAYRKNSNIIVYGAYSNVKKVKVK